MGYDVWVDGDWTIPAENVDKARPVILQALAKHNDHETYEDFLATWTRGEVPTTLPGILEKFAEDFGCDYNDDGNLIFMGPEGAYRCYDEDEWLFHAIAPFVDAPNALFNFQGEDGERWTWSVENGMFVEQHGQTVYGLDAKAPEVLKKIVELLYPDDHPITANNMPAYDWEQLACKIENIIREGGFGPQAGMNELDRLAAIEP